jgi:hypothetical protein
MLHSDKLKEIVAEVRTNIENGDIETALKHLNMVDMYADFNKIEEPRLVSAIQGLAKILGTSEPKALERVALQGFFDVGRIQAIGGKGLIQSEMDTKEPIIIAQILPNFGSKPMTDSEQSEYLENQMSGKFKRGA